MSSNNIAQQKESLLTRLIVIVSVAVPALVFTIFFIAPPDISTDLDLSFLPKFHAMLNFGVTILLLASWYFIKSGKAQAHKFCNIGALMLSAIFLGSYVVYHSMTEPTSYGGEGMLKYIYYFVLLTHIVLSAIILPIVLFTFLRAFTGDFKKHRKIARWTMPLWLYVSITGVIVYLLISPYY